MRHRSDPDEYNWSRIHIQTWMQNSETYRRDWIELAKGLGHISSLDRHSEYGDGIQIFLWDETDERDDDGDLKGKYMIVRGTTSSFWREEATWQGWLEVTPFREHAYNLLKENDLPIQEWTWVRVSAYWHKPQYEEE